MKHLFENFEKLFEKKFENCFATKCIGFPNEDILY